MTTCIWDENKLYADSQYNLHYMALVKKYVIANPNRLVFGAGDPNSLTRVFEWVKRDMSYRLDAPDDKLEEFTAVIVTRDLDAPSDQSPFYLQVLINESTLITIPNQLITLGSGTDFAQGALAAGAEPMEAMNIACNLDKHSGKPVVVIAWSHEQGFHIENTLALPKNLR